MAIMMRMRIRKPAGWLALLLSFLIAMPPAVLADDTELFTTSANPNVLLMLDTTGSMDAIAGSSSVGDLDGDSPSNSRMDILWKVVYTLLNADLSKPQSSASASGTLAGARAYPSGNWDTSGRVISAGSSQYDRIRLANFSSSEFNLLPDSGTVDLAYLGATISLAYTSKGTAGSWWSSYYYLAFPHQSFANDWNVGASVSYTYSGTYPQSYPTNETEAYSDDFLYNLTQTDEELLKARLGLMTFTTNSSGSTVLINIRNQIQSNDNNTPPFNTSYQDIWSSVKNYAHAEGGTPTARALREAQGFFDTAYNSSQVCRQNFAVMVTDGEDTMGGLDGATGNGYGPDYYCGGSFRADGWGCGWNTGQVARNNAVIQEAWNLLAHNPTVKLFTVGVGISDTTADKNVLRDVLRRAAEQQNAQATSTQYNTIGGTGDNTSRGAGRAFFATDANELSTALRNVFHQITSGAYSFTAPTVASVRMTDRNYLYKAIFTPSAPPATFWEGHLLAYTTDDLDNPIWDADNVLRTTLPSDRRVFAGYTDNTTWSRPRLPSSLITPELLGVDNTAVRDSVVNYLLGNNHDNNAKLGDIFHSKPVVVGPPSRFFFDQGYSSGEPEGSTSFVDAKATRRRIIYVGTNDGMLHAFLSGTYSAVTKQYDSGTGEELFGYVPYGVLNNIADFLPGDLTTHGYFVDSSPRVADVWIDANNDGVKQSAEWKTVLIGGLRKGGTRYFALDVTDPPAGDIASVSNYTSYPNVLWEYEDTAHVGETWSEPFIGKVRMQEATWTGPRDRWVAIFGGGKSDGMNAASLTVLDIATGTALKTFSGGTIDNVIVASPAAVLDAAGYIKFVYVNDLDGSLYKFNFQSAGLRSTSFAEWTVNRIFQPNAGQPVYHRVEAGTIDENTRYLYFGTGNQEYPVSDGGTGKLYAIKDSDSSTTLRTEGNLADLTANLGTGTAAPTQYGWFVNLGNVPSSANALDTYTHFGEKVLSDPVVFFSNVFFTTYTPETSNPCGGGGIARVYGLNTLNATAGLGAFTGEAATGSRVSHHVYSGSTEGSPGGIPSSPSLSIYPSGQSSIFIGFSTGAIEDVKIESPPHMKTIKSWKEIF
jgi:type IV pilus assembly protein PilY1